jgi:xylulokinase
MPAGGGYLLAIDVGTTTTRCILFDLEGRPVGEAYREPKVYHPRTTWTEVDPEDWWTCAVAVIRETLRQVEVRREEILGIGLCGLKHALVPINASGKPLARAMLWMDQRCRSQAEWLAREHGDLIEEVMGGRWTISTTPSAPKLRWIVEHEPDLLRRTYKFLLVKDFIRLRLTGTVATDPSDAGGTRLYDPRSRDWSYRLLGRIGVPPEKMPPIQDSTTVAGGVTKKAAQATGLTPGTPVVVGAGDVRCTLIGANAFHTRRACLYLGTAAWMSVARPGMVRRSLSADHFGATATTGAALKWLLALFGHKHPGSLSASCSVPLQEAGQAPLGARGLIFLPHLMGERAPQDDPAAKGTLFGLTLTHNRGDIVRAVLEGCAFQLRRIAETLACSGLEEGEPSVGPMVVVGGGAKSRLWLTIIADVTGIPLLVPRVLEAGALGASIYAGVGVGVYRSVQEAARKLVQITGRIEPDAAQHEQYGRVYSIYLELEDRVAPLYGRIPTE